MSVNKLYSFLEYWESCKIQGGCTFEVPEDCLNDS